MADINDINSAQSVKIIGADSNGAETTPLGVDTNGHIKTSSPRIIAATNSTIAPLGVSGVFTGTWIDVLGYTGMSIVVFSDQSNATNGLTIQWSSNGVNIDDSDSFNVQANLGKQLSFGLMARYVRVVYTNGSLAQSVFRLQTILHNSPIKFSSHRVNDTSIDDNDDAELSKAVMTGRTDAGTYVNLAVDTSGRLLTNGSSEVLSPLPGFASRSNKVLAAGASFLTTSLMTNNIAIVDFHFGGRGPGQASLLRIVPSATEQVPSGNFETNADVTTTWTNASVGDEALTAWARSTAQFTSGASSASKAFVKSDINNYPAIKYTWSTPKDVSAWRYIKADVYVTLATGGNQTRQTDIILTDINGATRTYTLSGNTVNAPVYPQNQWNAMVGEIENPTSSTGTFDVYNVSSITLRLVDGGNKTGTIYWDNVRFTDSQSLIERIYTDSNRTFQLILNPVELFNIGETLGLQYRNNDSVSREYTVTAKGVLR